MDIANSTSGLFIIDENGARFTSGQVALDSLSDVSVASPHNGNLLFYDDNNGDLALASPPRNTILLDDGSGVQIDLLQELKALRALTTQQRVLIKCGWCGQWGAVMTPCRHCGSPIDPE